MNQVPAERSRRLRHEAQRAEILEAAAAAIAEHGFHGMSMRELARATGRGLASFYNYFSSKEDVLFALQTGAFETLTRAVKGALANVDDPGQRLYVFILNHVRYVAEHRSAMRVVINEASTLPVGSRRRTVRLLKEAYFQIGRDIVASLLAAGCNSPGAGGDACLDPAEVERVSYSVFGMFNWSYGWYDSQRHGTPQDVARTIHAVAVCGLVAHCPHRAAQGHLEPDLGAIAPPPLTPKRARVTHSTNGPRRQRASSA